MSQLKKEWMIEIKQNGQVVMCKESNTGIPPKILHNDKVVFGIVLAETEEDVLDQITEYMIRFVW